MDQPSASFTEVGPFVFDYLGLKSMKRCRLVSKKWRELIDEKLNFEVVLSDKTKDAVIKFGLTKNPIDKLKISNLSTLNYPSNGIGFASVRKIVLRSSQISSIDLQKLLQEFDDVEVLMLRSDGLSAIKTPSCLMNVTLNNLQTIHISALMFDQPGYAVCGELLQNTFPSLRSFHVFFSKIGLVEPLFLPAFYIETYRFIARHRNSLKNAYLFNMASRDEERLLPGRIRFPEVPEDELNLIIDHLKAVQLLNIELEASCCVAMSPFLFYNRILEAQKTLKSMFISNIKESNWELWESLPKVFQQCSDTLKNVTINGFLSTQDNLGLGNGVRAIFSCSNIASCSKLEGFCLNVCGVTISEIEHLPKQIEQLHLGYMLTLYQIDYLSLNMTSLETLHLPQAIPQSKFVDHYLIPMIDVSIFKKILKFSQITDVILHKDTSDLNLLKSWLNHIAPRAIKISHFQDGFVGVSHPLVDLIYIEVDRSKFDPNKL